MHPAHLAAIPTPNIFGTGGSQVPQVADITLSRVMGWGIKMFFIVMGLLVLYYFLMAAFEWITSGGEEDKIAAARQKITHAAVGLVLGIALLSVWLLMTSGLMPFIKPTADGFEFCLPTINGPPCNCKAKDTVVTDPTLCCSGSTYTSPTAPTIFLCN